MKPADYFDRGERKNPCRVFVEGEGDSYTFSAAKDLMDRICAGLYAKGFGKGDSVAVYAPNDPLAVVCIFSIFRARGVWIPVNANNNALSNGRYLNFVSTRWLLFHSSVEAEVEKIVSDLPDLQGVFCIDASSTRFACLDELLAESDESFINELHDPSFSPEDVFSLWPTGGTTGPSKAVEMLNRNICTMYELGIQHYIDSNSEAVVYLAVAPITHAAGVIIPIFAAVGGTTTILRSFDPERVLRTVQEKKVTHMFLPPTAYYSLLDLAAKTKWDTSSLRQILLAAAPVSAEKMRQGVTVFGSVICQCYGQVEVPMLISWLGPEDVAEASSGIHPERLKSAGRVTASTSVSILDSEGKTLPLNTPGEICCRGPLVTRGYYGNEDATKEARRHGWHHTGDIGYFDEYGFLYIVDRIKDMIITGGFNVFATEVEEPILARDDVLECAVIGVPDGKWGEAVKAIVVMNSDNVISEESLISYVKPKLGPVKTPKSVEFWNSLPKTSVGKIDKKVIRERYWENNTRKIN